MATLYTIGNINLKRVKLVARAIKETFPTVDIHKVVIFNSKESEKLQNEQIGIYRRYFGNFIHEGIQLDSDGGVGTSQIFRTFSNDDEKIVDLSNGQKITAPFLYMAANLCKSDHICCLVLKTLPKEQMVAGKDYDYIRVKKMDSIEKLAKISHFDLIYYNDELLKLFSGEEYPGNLLQKIYTGFQSGIKQFFSDSDYRSVVANVTIGNEEIINTFIEFLQTDGACREFCLHNGINFGRRGDPVGKLTFFSRQCLIKNAEGNVLKLATLPNLIASLREYRNISAHYVRSNFELTEDQGRIVINLSLEVLKRIHENPDFWNLLKSRG